MKLIRHHPTPPPDRPNGGTEPTHLAQLATTLAVGCWSGTQATASAKTSRRLIGCLQRSLLAFTCLAALPLAVQAPWAHADPATPAFRSDSTDPRASLLVARTLERLALGDAFDAKLRQRIWVGGREVVGIGRYEQSGEGSGRLSLEMTIHDGDSRHELRQISDGKLAWFRSQVGDAISLRRVDVGRIKEIYQELSRPNDPLLGNRQGGVVLASAARRGEMADPVAPWLRVGGLVELLDRIAEDYDLRITQGKVDGVPVWILRGSLNVDARDRIMRDRSPGDWPALCPHEVRVAIAAVGDDSGFGVGLPLRIEYWSEPPRATQRPAGPEGAAQPSAETSETAQPNAEEMVPDSESHPNSASTAPPVGETPSGRLISLLEIYAIRKIRPSPEQRFRFEREERDISFSNDTRSYLDRLESSSKSNR